MLTPICVLRLVELRSRAVTAKEAATPRPAPVLSTKLVAKLTRRGFLVNALQETVPILREGNSTIVRRSKFTGIEHCSRSMNLQIFIKRVYRWSQVDSISQGKPCATSSSTEKKISS